MQDWISFFDSDHAIYVNARHRAVHAALIAKGLLDYVAPGARVLDYGCGEALHASAVATRAGQLILCDAAPQLRAQLAARVAADPKISVLDPAQVVALPAGTLDVIAMISVAQYLTPAQTSDLFVKFRRLLKPGGTLVVGDILQPGVSAARDAFALLRLGAANGFFIAAVFGLMRTLVSDYWSLRRDAGVTKYREDEMLSMLRDAGFSAQRAAMNIGHNQARMTFIARTPA
jgi:ubiquinone/menaquinone biosynthesis C-methylase UbiE